MGFQVLHQDSGSGARLGLLTTAHGQVETPVFMPVGTAGAVKGITPQQLEETGASMILANTYHLLLRPGVETIERLGGLHKFMAWNRPILTDSGGYQVFSLSPLTRIDNDGVEFASHVDGAKVYLNAEIATHIQNRLGVDVIMCFDQCTPFGMGAEQLEKAVARTILWAQRARRAYDNSDSRCTSGLFGIVQGGTNLDLRTHCAQELIKIGFDGYALGGLSVGEAHDDMIRTVAHTTKLLPIDKPRYLMGVGTPKDIIAAVMAGVDMFDCVLPTRNGRNAFVFTENGPLRLRNNAHVNDPRPIEADCDCYCCRNFSRGALRHFFNCGEMLGPILASLHNLTFYQRFMAGIRKALTNGELGEWAKRIVY
ncbi:MAG: tRNA guanosine(34) transglycosylase Tgt [Planctomycetes bacterium RBG_16_55_9]|nr:MAG: tRNA guanosine(34) transglycosylase Tgt [Planctomycetes bacterium RBG_16_55_9]